MTTFRLFIHRRDSVRWLVLAMAVGSIALAMAALACAPAAPASPGAGETAANAAASDQSQGDGSEPFRIPQQQSDEPTPEPTICSTGINPETDEPITECGPPPPTREPHELAGKLDSVLISRLENARKAEADRQRGVMGASGADAGPVKAERERVQIILAPDSNGAAVIAWLDQHEYGYNAYLENEEIYAAVDVLRLPELAKLEGVFSVWTPIENLPAN